MKFLSKFRNKFILSRKEKIEHLVNELIGELKKDGKSIGSPEISDDFGAFAVWVFRLGANEARISITKNDKWEVEVKPTFKEF